MSTVKQQLRAFYSKQGLTGKHLRKALQYDMKAVARNRNVDGDWSLIWLFGWWGSPQGGSYWAARV